MEERFFCRAETLKEAPPGWSGLLGGVLEQLRRLGLPCLQRDDDGRGGKSTLVLLSTKPFWEASSSEAERDEERLKEPARSSSRRWSASTSCAAPSRRP